MKKITKHWSKVMLAQYYNWAHCGLFVCKLQSYVSIKDVDCKRCLATKKARKYYVLRLLRGTK